MTDSGVVGAGDVVQRAQEALEGNRYTYRAEWSAEDDAFVGLVAEFPSLSHLADTPTEAIAGSASLVDELLTDMARAGEKPPTPLTERRYSGNLSVRTSSAQHRALVIEAAEQGVSVNQWINHKLSAHPQQSANSVPILPRLIAEIQRLLSMNGDPE